MASSRLGRVAEHLVGSRRQSELRLDGAASQAAAEQEEPRALTLEQKVELYHRGFVVLRNIVPPDVMCGRATTLSAAHCC